jgi:hypothetical protein
VIEVYWAGVGVVDQSGQVGDAFGSAGPQRHLEGVQDQWAGHFAGGPPADDAAGEHVDHERHVDRAGPGRDVGEVGYPQPVRCRGDEVAVDPVRWPVRAFVGDGGPRCLAADHATDAHLGHQSLHGAASDIVAKAPEVEPHFAGSEQLHEPLLSCLLDQCDHLGVAEFAPRCSYVKRRVRQAAMGVWIVCCCAWRWSVRRAVNTTSES